MEVGERVSEDVLRAKLGMGKNGEDCREYRSEWRSRWGAEIEGKVGRPNRDYFNTKNVRNTKTTWTTDGVGVSS